MDRKVFKANIEKLSVIYGVKDMSIGRISFYWDYLKEFSDEEFNNLCEQIILKERYFPSISVFFEMKLKNASEQKYPVLTAPEGYK